MVIIITIITIITPAAIPCTSIPPAANPPPDGIPLPPSQLLPTDNTTYAHSSIQTGPFASTAILRSKQPLTALRSKLTPMCQTSAIRGINAGKGSGIGSTQGTRCSCCSLALALAAGVLCYTHHCPCARRGYHSQSALGSGCATTCLPRRLTH